MIKRVIFDIDNTLMPWKKEYDNEIGIVLKEKRPLQDFRMKF